jgi:microcystin-dependent protein
VPYALHASTSSDGIPAGTIIAFGGETVPNGWLLCDGQEYSNNDYPNLRAAIQTNFGGTGSTFYVPDLRGRFLRGLDGADGTSSDRDPESSDRTESNTGGNTGNEVGSVQEDAFQGHGHDALAIPLSAATAGVGSSNRNSLLRANSGTSSNPGSGPQTPQNNYNNGNYQGTGGSGNQVAFSGNQPTAGNNYSPSVTNVRTTDWGEARYGNETRPKNVYVNYIIKH